MTYGGGRTKPRTASAISFCTCAATSRCGFWVELVDCRLNAFASREFDERRRIPAAELRSRLRDVVQRADEVMGGAGSDELLSRRQIQGYDVTVLEAIYHVVEHFGHAHGPDHHAQQGACWLHELNLWDPPSEVIDSFL